MFMLNGVFSMLKMWSHTYNSVRIVKILSFNRVLEEDRCQGSEKGRKKKEWNILLNTYSVLCTLLLDFMYVFYQTSQWFSVLGITISNFIDLKTSFGSLINLTKVVSFTHRIYSLPGVKSIRIQCRRENCSLLISIPFTHPHYIHHSTLLPYS